MKDSYKIRVPKKGAFTIETADDFISMRSVILAVAKRGVGKTCAFSNLLRLMKDNNALDILLLVSPTYHNNKQYFEGLGLDEETDVLEPEKGTPGILIEILDEEARLYEEYHEKVKMYKLLKKLLKSNIPIEHIDPFLLLEFGGDIHNFEAPFHKYGGKKPVITILFDDCQRSDLFKPSRKLSNVVILL